MPDFSLFNWGSMEHRSDSDELLIQYLLQELNDEERGGVEQRYVFEEEAHVHLLSVEQDLIDMYTREQLPPARRERFEQLYCQSPQQRRRVAFARSLESYLKGQPSAHSPAALALERTGRGSPLSSPHV